MLSMLPSYVSYAPGTQHLVGIHFPCVIPAVRLTGSSLVGPGLGIEAAVSCISTIASSLRLSRMGLLRLVLLTAVLLMVAKLARLLSLPNDEVSDPEWNRTLSEPVVLW